MPNGNTIITSTAEESVFEVDDLGNVQWIYSGDLRTARAIKYPFDYLSGNANAIKWSDAGEPTAQ